MSGSIILYYGPGGEPEARKQAREFGLLQPFKSGDLKKDDARELVSLLSQTPIGEKPWSVVVGPLDEVTPAVSDVLLKTLEEYTGGTIRPFLWAWDLGGVMPTIRSRSLHVFVPGKDERVLTSRPQAEKVFALFRKKAWAELVVELKDAKGDEEFLLLGVTEVLVEHLKQEVGNPELLMLWGALREVFSNRGAPLTQARVLSAFMKGVG